MNIDDYLDAVSLVDCSGRITHTLTLLVDGKVRVRIGHVDAVIDPATRTTLPKAFQLGRGEYSHDHILNLACEIARGG